MPTRADLTALLAETAWTRTLARSLAADGVLAEELVQDAWVAALERAPSTERSVRGWLAAVLRNRLSDLRREAGSRARREREAARPEALPSAHDVLVRATLQRELVEAVLELDEPYRTTVLLRFFEDLPQREIARRMQTTSATVNSRLMRALDKLRARPARGGGRAAWLQALVPLLREPTLAPVVTLGVPAMKLAAAVVVALSVLLGFSLWRRAPVEGRTEPSAVATGLVAELDAEPRVPEDAPGSVPSAAETPPASARTSAARPASEARPSAPAAASGEARTLRGRVLDPFGSGVAGVALVLEHSSGASGFAGTGARCTTGPGGWFEVDVDAPADAIVADDPRFATVLAGMARVQGATQPLVVVAPRIQLAGSVLDEAGAPIEGAGLELALPEGFGSAWGLALDYSLAQAWSARSGADGRFVLAGVPAVDGARLRAALGGYEAHAEPAPTVSERGLVIVLRRPRARERLVHGVVLDPAGVPVAGARVAARGEWTLSDPRGEFALDLSRAGVRPPLRALKRGYLPAELEPETDPAGEPLWPASVVLRLGGPPSRLHGRVVGDGGAPIAGARVWLDDPTAFSEDERGVVAAETLLGGEERFWNFVVTQADGTFELEGLLPRSYRLQALDPRTLVSVEGGPFGAADAPVELVLPTNDLHPRVAGRVLTRRGMPVPGVSVRLFRQTLQMQLSEGRQTDGMEARGLLTDEDGAFEFADVPKEGVHLLCSGDSVLFTGIDLAREDDVEDLEVEVSVRMHLQVELDPPHSRADRMRVLTADGQVVVLHVMRGEGAEFAPVMPILDGRSAVIALDEEGAVLELLRGEERVARLPLELVPGRTNVVRY
jgi:RNA polymerase sigma factor (sigma-70 family)